MGAGVSNWTLANAVSRLGQLGVVSGTALDVILVAAPAGRRRGRPHAPRDGRLPVPGDGGPRPREALRRGRQGRGRALPGDSDVRAHGLGPRARRALHRRELRRGLPRARGARRAGRDQLPREDPAARPAVDLRRDARRRRGRPDGRRDSDPRPGHPRPLRPARGGRVPARHHGLRRGRRHPHALRSVRLVRGRRRRR